MIERVKIRLLEKEYEIKCQPQEVVALKESARYLNKLMQEASLQQHLSSMESIAVLTALNVTRDFLMQKSRNTKTVDNTNQRIRQLQNKIEDVLSRQEELEV